MDLNALAQLLAAAGLGGVIASLVTNSSDRRQQRVALLEAVREYEVSQADKSREAYVTAALLAGLPRVLVREYLAAERRVLYARGNLREASGQGRAEHSQKLDRVLKAQRRIRNLQIQSIWHPWATLPSLRIAIWLATRGLNPTVGV